MLKEQKGITLVALIITIIVMLILAGVSISLVVGENGVLTQANEADVKTRKGAAKQAVELAFADLVMQYYGDTTKGSTVYTIDKLEDAIEAAGNYADANVSTTATSIPASGDIVFTVDGFTITITVTGSGTTNSDYPYKATAVTVAE